VISNRKRKIHWGLFRGTEKDGRNFQSEKVSSFFSRALFTHRAMWRGGGEPGTAFVEKKRKSLNAEGKETPLLKPGEKRERKNNNVL